MWNDREMSPLKENICFGILSPRDLSCFEDKNFECTHCYNLRNGWYKYTKKCSQICNNHDFFCDFHIYHDNNNLYELIQLSPYTFIYVNIYPDNNNLITYKDFIVKRLEYEFLFTRSILIDGEEIPLTIEDYHRAQSLNIYSYPSPPLNNLKFIHNVNHNNDFYKITDESYVDRFTHTPTWSRSDYFKKEEKVFISEYVQNLFQTIDNIPETDLIMSLDLPVTYNKNAICKFIEISLMYTQ
jgi:hypothetical protein